ncbi:MAG: DinB family protein [Acidobacteriaceae bacterium]|nr:DinB family protein [Acidobacteriaceae bacterium]MBV9498734.1 DinB family protein [Acidobacteriaceae bacterium]
MFKFCCLAVLAGAIAAPAFSQTDDLKSEVLKHLKTSRDFTVKVAEAMPENDYDFKLTPPQMSFAQQMVHLASGLDYFLAAFSGEKPNPPKPASLHKSDVIAFIKSQYDKAINTVSNLTPEQISKTYKSPEGTETGADLLLGLLDHSTHHRASGEMYLRAKGIPPPEYEF